MRLFLGIDINEDYHRLISELKKLNKDNTEIKWIKRENLHVTSLFIGDYPEENIDELINEISDVLSDFMAFKIEPERFVFIPPGKPRMLWLRFHNSKDFSRLSLLLHKQILNKEPDHPPRAHVTLSRFKKKPKNKIAFPEIEVFALKVKNINLYKSELKTSGAEYSILKEFYLK